MADLVITRPVVPAMSAEAIDLVRRLEGAALQRPQVPIRTEHVLHAGLYARTVHIPAGILITGALIRIPTLLICEGRAVVFVDGAAPLHLSGYTVLPAEAGRKQVIVAETDVRLTMIFPTTARSVEEAEAAFTDEADRLASRRDGAVNDVHVTEA